MIFSVISLTNYPITRRYVARATVKIKLTTIPNSNRVPLIVGHAVVQLVEALRYKPEGSGSDSRLRHWIFSLT